MPFTDWLAIRIGSRNWIVASRWTAKLREKYNVRLSQSEFTELRREFGRLNQLWHVGSP